jgi:hypothetical protein
MQQEDQEYQIIDIFNKTSTLLMQRYYSKAGNIEIGLGDASAEGDQQALQDPPPHPNIDAVPRTGTVHKGFAVSL